MTGTIDIEALRAFRADPRRNVLAWHRQKVFESTYRDLQGVEIDCFLERPIADLQEAIGKVQDTIARYMASGVYGRPATPAPAPVTPHP